MAPSIQTSIQRSILSTNRLSLDGGTGNGGESSKGIRDQSRKNDLKNEAGRELATSLSTVFVIVYLQEAAWICAPLIISLNVLLHSFLRDIGQEKILFGFAFGFFFVTALSSVIGLWCIHSRALAKLQQMYLLPFFVTKAIRICVLMIVAIYICIDNERRKWYFYVSLYAAFESLAGIVVLEIVYRSWKYLRKAKKQKNREVEVLWREPKTSIRSSQSIP
ncbi:unnamed protein product, partial [Mesorhabditis belari]|uniref:Uncharacterized protein n=1 Tax=Mesorhabditis belari TaxID=2138241 RepID=A0AAF3FGS5_9BILA